jgi:two-component system sensor histidine kinase KdpD
MQDIERIPTLEPSKPIDVSRVLLQTIIAIVGALLVTGIIYFFHLYPLIPNISFLYLPVVLAMASTFGLYPAIVASLAAFLSFDYFLVPPLYVFTIDRWEEWVALFIFLLTAILTSQLTVVLRERTALARRRERETKILYELIRLANSSERFEEQLGIVVESIVRVFAAWGVVDCALLLPGPDATLTLAAQATVDSHEMILSQQEQAMAVSTLTQGRMMEQRTAPSPDARDSASHISQYSTIGPVTTLRFIPLKSADQVLGVLALHIHHPVPWFSTIERMQQEQARSNSRIEFFWTFLEQATSILERAHLRESMASSNE